MQATSSPRKRLTITQREELLSAYRRSELTQREFAQRNGIGLSTLLQWLRKADAQPVASPPTFLPVPNLLAPRPPQAAFRIEWPGGLALEVSAGFNREELTVLVRLLQAL